MPSLRGAVAANLSPENARHELNEPETPGTIQMSQVDRPPLVLERLNVPCACGRPLVGCEYAIYGEPDGSGTVFIRGCCLTCGIQAAIFAPDETRAGQDTNLHLEIATMVQQVMELRKAAGECQIVSFEIVAQKKQTDEKEEAA